MRTLKLHLRENILRYSPHSNFISWAQLVDGGQCVHDLGVMCVWAVIDPRCLRFRASSYNDQAHECNNERLCNNFQTGPKSQLFELQKGIAMIKPLASLSATMLIGYARVSTNEQDTTAQASALKTA